MTTRLSSGFWAAAAALALAAAFAAPALAGAAAAPGARTGPGTQLWAARFRGMGDFNAMAVSPHGGRVFVAGASYGGQATSIDYKTVAYSGATGRPLWASRYSGPGQYADYPTAVAASPSGRRVFVTGYARGWGTGQDYATVAYNAATGRQLWASRYTSPGKYDDQAWSVAVSPDGATVFVTGGSDGGWTGINPHYATVAYSAATGRQLWVSLYTGPGKYDDQASSVAVSPDGAAVFVTGWSHGLATDADYATVAYSAATGRQLWVSRYNGPGNGWDAASSVAVSPVGATVFVTGESVGRTAGNTDYATLAYRAATGKELWASRYTSPANGEDGGLSMAVSPDGATVFVTGRSTGRTTGDDYATLAYRAATGKKLWASRYTGPGKNDDTALSVAVSPNGARVYVTGYSAGRGTNDDYATVAYRAATGRQLWVTRYNGPGRSDDYAYAVAVSPDGATVYVTGIAGDDDTTIAYRG